MGMNYAKAVSRKQTPQSQPIPGKKMKKNNAGGYSFETDKWTQLERFLVLGTEGGTFYVGQQKLTRDNADAVERCIVEDGVRTVNAIVECSHNSRAPKNDPAIFALALACTVGDEATKVHAYQAISKVCRIGTHIFQFCDAIQQLRGWSRGLRNGVSKYYLDKTPDQLAYHLIKYRQREGWTHQDVLRLSHPKATEETSKLLSYAVGKTGGDVHPQIEAYEVLKTATAKQAVKLIKDHNLPREAVPTKLLNSKEVWEALLESMPMTALIRNLGKMSSIGLTGSGLDAATKKVVKKLKDRDTVQKSRIHPLQVLVASRTYLQGHGTKGSLSWAPVAQIVDALDDAFYMAFDNVEPTNQNWMLAVDVSGSMQWGNIAGMPITPAVAAATMAMVTARTEPNHEIVAFSHELVRTSVSSRQRLNDVVTHFASIPMGGTDCALPMIDAAQRKLDVDTFVVYTDSETWAGYTHPKQALDQYRQKMGKDAKLVVVGMESNNFTIADPSDAGMLDVCGFSTAVPTVLSQFSLGL